MLATIAALQLALLSQVAPPPREVTPDEKPEADPAPSAADAPQTPPPAATLRAEAPAPSAMPAAPAAPTRPRQHSLLSGEPLGGASTVLAWAGWSSLGIAYGQGVTDHDDLGAFLDYDWSTSEFRLGGFYRRPLGQAGVFDMAGRISVAWYENFGSDWVHEDNHSDRGFEVTPGLSLSNRVSGGIFSMLAEAPLTVTTKYGSGLLFAPRFSVAYEAPLYPELTLGTRLGIGYRAGSGDAPIKEGDASFTFLVLATYQLL